MRHFVHISIGLTTKTVFYDESDVLYFEFDSEYYRNINMVTIFYDCNIVLTIGLDNLFETDMK